MGARHVDAGRHARLELLLGQRQELAREVEIGAPRRGRRQRPGRA